jgi:hypothetical protein
MIWVYSHPNKILLHLINNNLNNTISNFLLSP